MTGTEIAAMSAVSGVIIGVLTTHFGTVSNLKSKTAVHDSRLESVEKTQITCRNEINERLKSIEENVVEVKETLARMNGAAHRGGK